MEKAGQSPASRPSRSRSRSRPRRSDHPLHRILSSQFPDDHSVYHHENGEGLHINSDASSFHKTETERRDTSIISSDDDDSADDVEGNDEASGEKEAVHEDEGVQEEDIDGKDVEASPLEKKKTSRSMKDPNLVSYE